MNYEMNCNKQREDTNGNPDNFNQETINKNNAISNKGEV